ncbi:MAG TPA: polyprenol monophosphomannose synthase [Gaiellaceae bacterium]|nr:polyprenol monophosphomannose synthase [Gaiellaceae bacterium]
MRLVICLPTYNERANLEPLVRRLGDLFAERDLDARVLVIDDSSPDGTGEIADRLSDELPFLSVLHRSRKEGLGPAYIAGFRWALENGADLILQMDADFSHDPADVPTLLAATESADLALGSRYVEGGGTENWGRGRQRISRFGSFYARAILGVSVRDLTGGFKCWRREALAALPLDRVRTKGYAFQIETTYRALVAGFRVAEVPIVFAERRSGGSKMTRGIVLEAMTKVPELRLRAALRRL